MSYFLHIVCFFAFQYSSSLLVSLANLRICSFYHISRFLLYDFCVKRGIAWIHCRNWALGIVLEATPSLLPLLFPALLLRIRMIRLVLWLHGIITLFSGSSPRKTASFRFHPAVYSLALFLSTFSHNFSQSQCGADLFSTLISHFQDIIFGRTWKCLKPENTYGKKYCCLIS